MSWVKKTLGELCTIQKGKIGIQKATPGEFPLVVTAEERLTHNEYHFEGTAVIIPLVSSTGHGHKSLKRIHFQSGKFAVGNILCAVIPKDENVLRADYLYRFLDINREKELVSRMKGMANVTLPMKEIAKVEIPVPPIEAQIDFVQQYSVLEEKSNDLGEEIIHQLDLVKQLRQACLREAMQGHLVPQDPNDLPANPQNKFFIYILECSDGSWYKGFTTDIIKRWKEHISGKGAEHTKKYPPVKLIHWEEYETEQEAVSREKFLKSGHGRDWLKQKEKLGQLRQAGEPASVLFEKIKAEKERLIKEKKIKKQKPLPPITEDEIPFEIPENWVWCRLGKITSILGDGLHGTPSYTKDGEYYFVNGNNLVDGEIIFKENTKRVNEDEFEKYKKDLCSRTVLVSINGTLGNVAVYNGEKIILGKSACYFNLLSGIDKWFIKRFVDSQYFLEYAVFVARQTTIKNVSLQSMRLMLIPLPPLSEQQSIVAKLDELMQYCDELEVSIKESQTQNELLLQQVLREALEPASDKSSADRSKQKEVMG